MKERYVICSKCKQELDSSFFCKASHRKNGLYPSCKNCRSKAWFKYKETQAYKDRHSAIRISGKRYADNLRFEIIKHYSQGLFKCMCPGCNVNQYAFLAIDHIEGGGNQHRNGGAKKINVYTWLKRNNFPTGFQVLCHNCNMAKGFYGECPHVKEQKTNA